MIYITSSYILEQEQNMTKICSFYYSTHSCLHDVWSVVMLVVINNGPADLLEACGTFRVCRFR